MRDYGKVYTAIWASSSFRSLSEDGRALALYLLTCQHGTITGTFRMPDGYASEDLQWTSQRVSKGFGELFANGFANRCETTKWVWVVNFLEWNPPENPNQQKAAAKQIKQVPDQCLWRADFIRVCGPSIGIEAPPQDEPFANPLRTLCEPGTEAGTEAVSVEAKASTSSPVATSKPGRTPEIPCPYDQIVEAYHEALPSLPGIRDIGDKRKRAMQGFWRWVLTSKTIDGERRANNGGEAIAYIRAYFAQAGENDFLLGKRSVGVHAGWKADLDFLLTEKGRSQVLERTEIAA